MNWGEINESSRERIESLMKAFETFIVENHKGTDQHDDRIKK